MCEKKFLKFHTFFGGGVWTKSMKVHTFFFEWDLPLGTNIHEPESTNHDGHTTTETEIDDW